MATILVMRAGHQYRVADTLTLAAVNTALNQATDRFIEVPLAADGATAAGTPGAGEAVTKLFITPDSVSHFYVV